MGDDDTTIRSTVEDLLSADRRFEVVGTAADGRELLALVNAEHPDLVLVDVRMPHGGAEVARALAGSASESHGRTRPKVVTLSADVSAEVLIEMLRAGAVSYLTKGYLGGSLADLLARVAGGEVILAAPTAQLVLQRLVGDAGDATTPGVTPPDPST
ncbi:response regulator [Nocardioides sp.]|uniref:response regulator transcription factor n=1 Tax=Nocardioides sp. TaxID=35761 RepID=UPI001A29718D|nr:response regulator [Nocardioides sp.]MBJ7358381.1 response regulator transcription factor [Nocardioides sp.]